MKHQSIFKMLLHAGLYLLLLGVMNTLSAQTSSSREVSNTTIPQESSSTPIIIEKSRPDLLREFVFTDVVGGKSVPLAAWLSKVNNSRMAGLISYEVNPQTNEALLLVSATIADADLTHIFSALGVNNLPIKKQ
jgi:hypothetical protein